MKFLPLQSTCRQSTRYCHPPQKTWHRLTLFWVSFARNRVRHKRADACRKILPAPKIVCCSYRSHFAGFRILRTHQAPRHRRTRCAQREWPRVTVSIPRPGNMLRRAATLEILLAGVILVISPLRLWQHRPRTWQSSAVATKAGRRPRSRQAVTVIEECSACAPVASLPPGHLRKRRAHPCSCNFGRLPRCHAESGEFPGVIVVLSSARSPIPHFAHPSLNRLKHLCPRAPQSAAIRTAVTQRIHRPPGSPGRRCGQTTRRPPDPT